jgi:hypothetical protein
MKHSVPDFHPEPGGRTQKSPGSFRGPGFVLLLKD